MLFTQSVLCSEMRSRGSSKPDMFDGPCAAALTNRRKENIVKVVVIRGVAAGPKAAARIIRMRPDADVTIADRLAMAPDDMFVAVVDCKT